MRSSSLKAQRLTILPTRFYEAKIKFVGKRSGGDRKHSVGCK